MILRKIRVNKVTLHASVNFFVELLYCVIEWHITLFGPTEICTLGNVPMKDEIMFVNVNSHRKLHFLFFDLVIPLPPDWDSHPLDQKGREKRLHLVLLEEQSSEYQGVERMFMQSMTNEKVCIN